MKIITFHATEEGGSRFAEIDIPLDQTRDDGMRHTIHHSIPWMSPAAQFVHLPAGMDQDWHHAPARQVVVVLDGELEVETSDGETRRWRRGGVFLPADLTGKGHRTRCIDGPVSLLFVPWPEA
jgi:hypothetical protein